MNRLHRTLAKAYTRNTRRRFSQSTNPENSFQNVWRSAEVSSIKKLDLCLRKFLWRQSLPRSEVQNFQQILNTNQIQHLKAIKNKSVRYPDLKNYRFVVLSETPEIINSIISNQIKILPKYNNNFETIIENGGTIALVNQNQNTGPNLIGFITIKYKKETEQYNLNELEQSYLNSEKMNEYYLIHKFRPYNNDSNHIHIPNNQKYFYCYDQINNNLLQYFESICPPICDIDDQFDYYDPECAEIDYIPNHDPWTS